MCEAVERPRRPAITPLLYALTAVVVTERLMLREDVSWLGGMCGKGVLIVAGLLLLACIPFGSLRPTLIVVGIAACCAMAVTSLDLDASHQTRRMLGDSAVHEWSFIVQADAQEGTSGYRCRALASHDGHSRTSVWLVSSEPYDMGTCLSGVGRFAPLGDDEWAVSSRMQGICGTVRLMRVGGCLPPNGVRGWVNDLRREVLRQIDPTSSDGRALLAGCICGWRRDLHSSRVDELFSRCGAAHLVAVSGGHLSVLAGMLDALLVGLAVRPRVRFGVVGLTSGVFVLLCGVPLSAVRAWVMSMSAMMAGVCGRRSHGLSGVCVAGLAMALADPTFVGRLGFMLSVCSVMGLCLYGPYATYVLDSLLPHVRLPRWVPSRVRRAIGRVEISLRQSACTSMLVQMVTLPLVASAFGEVPLVGPVTNALISYPFTLLMGMGLLFVGVGWSPPVRSVMLRGCDALAAVVLAMLRAVDSMHVPALRVVRGSVLPLVCAGVLVLVLLAWPRLSRRVLVCGCVIGGLVLVGSLVRWRLFAPPRICVLDVGQGDAILIQDGSHAILVDAGPDDAVVDALAREHVLHLDAAVITHLHDDHYGGIQELVDHVPCDQVFVGLGAAQNVRGDFLSATKTLTGSVPREVGYGDMLHVGDFALRVISPVGEKPGDQNADSLEMLVTYARDGEDLTALLTGDAEKDQMDAALVRGDLCDIDFLKVGHHGSEVSITREQALEIAPEVSVASAGEGNSYGHPTRECIKTLEEAGSKFLCTKDCGDIDVRPGTEGPRILTQGHSLEEVLL